MEKALKSENIQASYTAAGSLPLKVIMNDAVRNTTREGWIPPIHLQLNPTNRCNLDCDICSCSGRDKNLELNIETQLEIIDRCLALGTQSVTITGGGEPLLYPHFKELVEHCQNSGIKVGLVTNGILLGRVDKHILNMLTWCRISHADGRHFTKQYADYLADVMLRVPIDWAFSYVVSTQPQHEDITRLVHFAKNKGATHVRLVSNIFLVDRVPMDSVRSYLSNHGIDDRLVIYQGRQVYTRGMDCYICYLKPVIGADGKLYTCCGAQYALSGDYRDYPPELCLGDALDIKSVIEHSSHPFDGSICEKCYYGDYNNILAAMLSPVRHEEFV